MYRLQIFSIAIAVTITLFSSCDNSSESKTVKVATRETENNTEPAPITQVISQARIEPEGKIAKLSSPVSGIVVKLYKEENDNVQAGELLVELDHPIESVKLAQSESRLITQQAKIKMLGFEMDEFRSKYNNKKKEWSRLLNLLKNGSETQQRIDDVETELRVLESSVKKSEANLEMAKAELGEIKSQVELAKRELEQRYLKAPANGKLISMEAIVGGSVDTQTSYAEFIPTGRIIARAEVDELFANRIKVGQNVDVRLVGSQEVLTTGLVFYTAPTLKKKSLFSEKAGDQEDRRVREIKIELKQEDKLLINSRVECVIKL